MADDTKLGVDEFDEKDEGAFRYWADCNSEPSKQLNELESFIEGRRYEHSKDKAVIQGLRAEVEHYEKSAGFLQIRASAAEDEIQTLKAENDKAIADINEMRREAQELKAENSALKDKVWLAQDEGQNAIDEFKIQQRNCEILRADIAELTAFISDLEPSVLAEGHRRRRQAILNKQRGGV